MFHMFLLQAFNPSRGNDANLEASEKKPRAGEQMAPTAPGPAPSERTVRILSSSVWFKKQAQKTSEPMQLNKTIFGLFPVQETT